MAIYEITAINQVGTEFENYIVAENINQVFDYLKVNCVCQIINIRELGRCTKILKGDSNEI